MNIKKTLRAMAFVSAIGVSGPIMASMQPLTCDALEKSRTQGVADRKAEIDEKYEYEEQYETVDLKNQCLADIGEVMSAHVGGSGSVLSQISDLLGDTLANEACDAVKSRADSARSNVEKSVNDIIKDSTERHQNEPSYEDLVRQDVEAQRRADEEARRRQIEAEIARIRNENNGSMPLSDIYDLLGSMY